MCDISSYTLPSAVGMTKGDCGAKVAAGEHCSIACDENNDWLAVAGTDPSLYCDITGNTGPLPTLKCTKYDWERAHKLYCSAGSHDLQCRP